jgi:hypothetical protein
MSEMFERVVAPTSVEPACPAALRVAEAAGGTGSVCRITGLSGQRAQGGIPRV